MSVKPDQAEKKTKKVAVKDGFEVVPKDSGIVTLHLYCFRIYNC